MKDNTAKLLGLEDVIVKNISEDDNSYQIEIELPRRSHKCPACREKTDKIRDYRGQQVKDISVFGKNVYLLIRKPGYVCNHCGKRFYEKNKLFL